MLRVHIHTYRALAHPIAQMEAAREFYEYVDAFVQDEWEALFDDEPPSARQIDRVTPRAMLASLEKLKLRFEMAGHVMEDGDDSYWTQHLGESALDGLLWGNAFRVIDQVGLDARAFEHGLMPTDLIFVPDDEHVVPAARKFLLAGERNLETVLDRYDELEDLRESHLKRDRTPPKNAAAQGDGPREADPAVADRAAIAIRDANIPLSAEEVASRMGHSNAASVAAALHQIVAYRKPKRLCGWVQRNAQGKYVWAG